SSGQVCTLVGIRVRQLYRLIDEGALPAYRIGRAIKVKRSDLERFAGPIEAERLEKQRPWSSRLVDSNEVAAILGLSHRDSVQTYLHWYLDMPRPVTGGGRGAVSVGTLGH